MPSMHTMLFLTWGLCWLAYTMQKQIEMHILKNDPRKDILRLYSTLEKEIGAFII